MKGLFSSVRVRILTLVIAGPLLMAAMMYTQGVSSMKENFTANVEEKSKLAVDMADATRDLMARKLAMGVTRLEGTHEQIMEAVPIISALQVAEMNADKNGFAFRVPRENPRNTANTPTAFESKILAEFKATGKDEILIVEDDQIRYFRAIKLTQDCMVCHGAPKGATDPIGGIKEGWKVGDISGAFEITSSLAEAKAKVMATSINVGLQTLVALAVLSLLSLWVVRRGLFTPLQNLQEYAEDVAKGDLDAKPEGKFTLELHSVREAIEHMVGSLKIKMKEAQQRGIEADKATVQAEDALKEANKREAQVATLLSNITDVAGRAGGIAHAVAGAADTLSSQVSQASSGTEVQNQRTAETSTAMEEMNATVLEVARSSGSAADSADQARVKAEEGAAIVENSVRSISAVYEQAQSLKEEMTTLDSQVDGISRIMVVISDIADQTNLLALNAAIEAARAGDAGKGFAVVADEVRKLAEKTMEATKEVGSAIETIQRGAGRNLESVEVAASAIEEATKLVTESGSALQQIVELVVNTSDQVRSIATAAEQQSAASEEINHAVDDISRISMETADGMSQARMAVESLAGQAGELRNLIDEMNSQTNARS